MTRNQASDGNADGRTTVIKTETLHIAAHARELANRRLRLQQPRFTAGPLTTA